MVKEYFDMWKSIFDVEKLTSKKDFNIFVGINFLCILIIYKVSEFSENKNLINTVTILFFALTFILGVIKSKVPKITRKIFKKIVLASFLVGIINVLVASNYSYLDNQGYATFIFVAISMTIYPIITAVCILFFNVFKKDKISDLELVIYFIILLGISTMQTLTIMEDFSG